MAPTPSNIPTTPFNTGSTTPNHRATERRCPHYRLHIPPNITPNPAQPHPNKIQTQGGRRNSPQIEVTYLRLRRGESMRKLLKRVQRFVFRTITGRLTLNHDTTTPAGITQLNHITSSIREESK